jgi:adenylate kinase
VRTEGEEEIKKMPFRNYLMEFVVPTLNEGLLEVSNIIPNDPVDLLAEYLYQKSYDF